MGAGKQNVRYGTPGGSGQNRLSRRVRPGHVAAWVATIATMVGTVYTALDYYEDRDSVQANSTSGTSSEERTGESSTTVAPSEEQKVERYSEAETRLGRRITPTPPREASLSCQRASESKRIAGALAALECVPRSIQFPVEAIAASFEKDRGDLNDFVDSEASHVDSSTASEDIIDNFPCPYDGPWLNVEGIEIGRLICYSEGDTYSIVWSFENDSYVDKYNETFVVKASSTDRQALAEWWMATPV